MKEVSRNPPSWTVNVPLNDLLQMQNSLAEVNQLRDENRQLQNRIEGLHRTLYDLMTVVQDMRGRATA